MIPTHPTTALFFLLIWIILGTALGWVTSVVMTWLLPRSKSTIVLDIVFGVIGCLIGVFVSGWASQHTFNSGSQRTIFVWDENGRAVDWRTALAEHQAALAILGAIMLVACWRFAIVAYRNHVENKIR